MANHNQNSPRTTFSLPQYHNIGEQGIGKKGDAHKKPPNLNEVHPANNHMESPLTKCKYAMKSKGGVWDITRNQWPQLGMVKGKSAKKEENDDEVPQSSVKVQCRSSNCRMAFDFQ